MDNITHTHFSISSPRNFAPKIPYYGIIKGGKCPGKKRILPPTSTPTLTKKKSWRKSQKVFPTGLVRFFTHIHPSGKMLFSGRIWWLENSQLSTFPCGKSIHPTREKWAGKSIGMSHSIDSIHPEGFQVVLVGGNLRFIFQIDFVWVALLGPMKVKICGKSRKI